MELTEKCAYIKGLMEGLELDVTTKEGKVLNAMIGLLEEICHEVSELSDCMDEVYGQLDEIDEDIDSLTDAVFAEDDEEDDEFHDEEEYELTCPKCGGITIVDVDTLMDENAVIRCAECGEVIEVELVADEEASEE